MLDFPGRFPVNFQQLDCHYAVIEITAAKLEITAEKQRCFSPQRPWA
jgi:hypothetical protein